MKGIVMPGRRSGESDFLLDSRLKENTNYRIAKNNNIMWVGIIFNELISSTISAVSSFDALANGLNKHWEN